MCTEGFQGAERGPKTLGALHLPDGVACVGTLAAIGVCAKHQSGLRCCPVYGCGGMHAQRLPVGVPLSSGGRRGPLPAEASAGEAAMLNAAAMPKSMPPPLLTMGSSHIMDFASAPVLGTQ